MTLRVGLIGCGGIMRPHVEGWKAIANRAQIVAVADVVEGNAKARIQQLGYSAAIYADYRDLLEDDEIDAVDIALPHHLHRDSIVAATEAGKHVLTEKPLCLTMEHLREIVALVRQCALAYGEEPAYQVELATSEIVTNIIEHACDNEGQIRVRVALYPLEIRIDLYDDGGPCDLASIPDAPLGEPQQGGYGLHIARQLLDELSYTVNENGNHWRLLKTIPEKKETYGAD